MEERKTTEEINFVGGWWAAIKKCAPESFTVIMRGKMRIKTRPSDKEALELLESFKDKTFGDAKKILDDAQFWLHMIQILSFEKEKATLKRLEVRQTINEAGHEFFENIHSTNKELGDIAGEFMALNEEYVLNNSGEEETNRTVDILQAGFTTNQLKFLEQLRETITGVERIKEINFLLGAVDGKTSKRVKRLIRYLHLYQWAYGELQLVIDLQNVSKTSQLNDTERRREEIRKKLHSELEKAGLPLGIKYE